MSTLDGSEIISNSRYDGMDFRSMTLGKTQTVSIPMTDPESWERTTMISI